MRGQRIGSLVGAVFGLIYVLVNAGPLPPVAAMALRAAAAAAFCAVLAALYLRRHDRVADPDADQSGKRGGAGVFGRAYWIVVAAEVAALAVGLAVLDGPLNVPRAGVAWVSIVVGVHFNALAVVFGLRFFHWLGGAITACGVIGLALVATAASAIPVSLISGIVPGALLLGFGFWGARATSTPPTG